MPIFNNMPTISSIFVTRFISLFFVIKSRHLFIRCHDSFCYLNLSEALLESVFFAVSFQHLTLYYSEKLFCIINKNLIKVDCRLAIKCCIVSISFFLPKDSHNLFETQRFHCQSSCSLLFFNKTFLYALHLYNDSRFMAL